MTETRWLDEAEMRAWRGYVETVGTLTAALESDLQPHGLTMGDYEVLVFLSEAPDHRLRMSDLAARLRLSPSGLTRRLDGMVRVGLVTREASPIDRRATMAVLTAHGAEVLRRAAPDHVASVRRHLLDHLTPEQIEMMGAIFAALGDSHRGARKVPA